MAFTKLMIVVDEDVDVHDQQQVFRAVAANMCPDRDTVFQQGPPDPLDPVGPLDALGSCMAIDATAKVPGECPGEPPQPAVMSEDVRGLVSERWNEYGLGPDPGANGP